MPGSASGPSRPAGTTSTSSWPRMTAPEPPPHTATTTGGSNGSRPTTTHTTSTGLTATSRQRPDRQSVSLQGNSPDHLRHGATLLKATIQHATSALNRCASKLPSQPTPHHCSRCSGRSCCDLAGDGEATAAVDSGLACVGCSTSRLPVLARWSASAPQGPDPLLIVLSAICQQAGLTTP